jgi:hypothetical protein
MRLEKEEAKKLLEHYNKVIERFEEIGECLTRHGFMPGGASFQDIDEDIINYTSDEYWAFGGHEHHYMSVPLTLMWGDEEQYCLDMRAESLDKEEKAKAAEEAAALAKKKAEYEKLKEQFEGGTE